MVAFSISVGFLALILTITSVTDQLKRIADVLEDAVYDDEDEEGSDIVAP